MTLGPLPLVPIIERLRAEVPSIRILGTAADLRTALAQKPAQTPAIFALVQERGRPQKGYTGQFVQDVDATLQLVQFTRNFAQQPSGAAVRDDMDAFSTDVRSAVIGWTPGGAYRAFELQGSKDEDYAGGLLCRQQVFRTTYRIQVNA